MKKSIFGIVICLLVTYVSSIAQEQDAAKAAQSNNPLANMTAFVYQNYYMPKLNEAPVNSYQNTTWVRFAKPIAKGKQLLRASLPITTLGSPNDSTGINSTIGGLGDLNAFYSFNFVTKPTTTVGIGPNITMPTATEKQLGTGKWQGGFAFVAFKVHSPAVQYGILVTYQHSFAGDEDRPETSNGAIQPFYFFQLGKGTYLRGAPVWYFDFENGNYSFPVGLGIGKVMHVGKKSMCNLFFEPQYSVWTQGTQPQVQLMAGIIFQMVGK